MFTFFPFHFQKKIFLHSLFGECLPVIVFLYSVLHLFSFGECMCGCMRTLAHDLAHHGHFVVDLYLSCLALSHLYCSMIVVALSQVVTP